MEKEKVRYIAAKDVIPHLRGPGKGQDDSINTDVPEGTYIIDASSMSDLGDGSSSAGAKELARFCDVVLKKTRKVRLSANGDVIKLVPVALSNDEYAIPKDIVTIIGDGDNKRGSRILDRAIKRLRKHKRNCGTELPPKAHPFEYYLGD